MKNYILQKHSFRLQRKLLFLLVCLAFTGCIVTGCGKKDTDVFLTADTEETSETGTESDPESQETSQTETLVIDGTETTVTSVFVYVCGAVENPDVYELPAGSRICDALTAAGGMTEEAADDYWNQAEILTDGEMIYIPTMEEAEERRESESASEEAAAEESENDGKININTASKAELMTISGIGEGRAENIIKYREANGDFEKPEDITNVSGIGDALYESMKDAIKVN